MYTYLRLRSQLSLEELCAAFDEYTASERLVLNAMAHRALKLTSTASAPVVMRASASEAGLRKREDLVERPFTPTEGGDRGNVKVVVRVRKFVQRGGWICLHEMRCLYGGEEIN